MCIRDRREALLSRISPTTNHEALTGCDLVIEAVFEDRARLALIPVSYTHLDVYKRQCRAGR